MLILITLLLLFLWCCAGMYGMAPKDITGNADRQAAVLNALLFLAVLTIVLL